ncbi:DUF2339 domain-containing protein [Mucilaginibacter segetis]|uniref:DUF2339 domain-containing protein n=1 Tax=Mucilaginibacter segetis TaxID=2793071 RepID=A0A934PWB5_9SPHI|nr:DUF2339 domain-containing protein [Mucilaginibacter segetis]MBK0380701.1 DUF2339 domain-containing protein [Mucilaginibacter segetis]
MEFIYVVLLLVIIYLLITNKNANNEKIAGLEYRLFELQKLIRQITLINPTEKTTKSEPITDPEEAPKPEPVISPVIKPPAPIIIKPKSATHHDDIANTQKSLHHIDKPSGEPLFEKQERKLSFFEQYPDLEKFIGENLVNKIGIAILVLAIGFFVKYAIDNNWVGPVGRVSIGVICGGILIGIAHRLRNSYRAFSSVLVGGGLAVLYFTITLAYHQFHLFNQTASFIILIVITAFAVVLSLLYNKQELAVIALVGGLLSPFLVSSDQANYIAFFTYLVILNAGLLVIAYNKSWRILNATAFGLTAIVFLATLTTLTESTYSTGFWYAGILYLMFFSINVANNIKENKKFIASDFTILLVNTGLYFALGLYLLSAMHQHQMRGLFSAALAVINLILSFLLFRNKKADNNILYLLIGITLTFISLTAPIQLNGHYITLFWAAETVLLYWLYLKSNIRLMKLTSLIVAGAMLISLMLDWVNLYGSSYLTLTIIANKGFITTVVAALSFYLLSRLVEQDSSQPVYGISLPPTVFKYIAFIFFFLSGLLEVNHQFSNRYPNIDLNVVYIMMYIPAFIFSFYILTKRIKNLQFMWPVAAGVMAICIIVYLFAMPVLFNVQYNILIEHKVSVMHFAAHWLGAIFISMLFYQLISLCRSNIDEAMRPALSWILAGAVVLFLSLEVSLVCNMLFYKPGIALSNIQTVYIKVGLPILWGLSSFAFMILGMRGKVRTLRIISLTLFTITLVKLFVFDIRGIPPAGKIAAFFSLGVLLLIVSFMYQKVKKIIVSDEIKKNDE